jgi:hypothetical protein
MWKFTLLTFLSSNNKIKNSIEMCIYVNSLSDSNRLIEKFSRLFFCIYIRIGSFVVYDLRSESEPAESSQSKHISELNFVGWISHKMIGFII